MNIKLKIIYTSILSIILSYCHILLAEQSPYDLEFDYISKVIQSNNVNVYPTEFWSLRDTYLEEKKAQNESELLEKESNGLFDLAEAILAISKDPEAYIKLFPQEHKDLYKARLDQLIEISETAFLMKEDLWCEDYVNHLLKHIIGLRAAGISEKLPKLLWNPRVNSPISIESNFLRIRLFAPVAYDENFRRFGALRSYLPEKDDCKDKWLDPPPYQSIIWSLRQYMINVGADEDFIKQFALESRVNSDYWLPQAVKAFFVKCRNLPPSSYFSGSQFFGSLNDKASSAVVILHAFTQEILKATRFRHQDTENKTLRVMRALRSNPINLNIVTHKGENKYTMPQGIFDSVSSFFPFTNKGTITIFHVPYHRILGMFFMEKAAGFATADEVIRSGLFLDDPENELLAMLEGIPFEIVSLENLDLNGNTAFDSYALNYYYKNRFSLVENDYAKDNLNKMFIKASWVGDIDAARLFLELGANPNILDFWGKSALYHAVRTSHTAIVRLLLEKGADPNLKDQSGKTPLYYAAEAADIPIINLLLDQGADLNPKDQLGKTPLSYAVEIRDIPIVNLLLEKGANPNIINFFDKTLLSYAIETSDIAIVSLLLEAGADPNFKNQLGKTPLYYAIQNGDIAIIRLLLDKGANLNPKGRLGKTPLYHAVRTGNAAIVHLLLQKGADPNTKDSAGKTPLDIAIQYKKMEIIRLLEKSKNDIKAHRKNL